jgi:AAA+ ATPase superfamily predicted ATPase
MFIGRTAELEALQAEFNNPRPSLLVVYGRRRVGKSELLRQATKGRPRVFYQATRVTGELNLEAFKARFSEFVWS